MPSKVARRVLGRGVFRLAVVIPPLFGLRSHSRIAVLLHLRLGPRQEKLEDMHVLFMKDYRNSYITTLYDKLGVSV